MMKRLVASFFLAVAFACGLAACAGNDGCDGILCNDGFCSRAENRQGACSSHGGIAPGDSRTSLTAPSSGR
jgi:hypothetical protein